MSDEQPKWVCLGIGDLLCDQVIDKENWVYCKLKYKHAGICKSYQTIRKERNDDS